MSTARAIQVSVVHVTLGILIGAGIESIMPDFSASSSTATLAFEAFAQVALNGVLISMAGEGLTNADPTYGIPFSLGLFASQPGLDERLVLLAGVARQQASRLGLKMALPVREVEQPNQEM